MERKSGDCLLFINRSSVRSLTEFKHRHAIKEVPYAPSWLCHGSSSACLVTHKASTLGVTRCPRLSPAVLVLVLSYRDSQLTAVVESASGGEVTPSPAMTKQAD